MYRIKEIQDRSKKLRKHKIVEEIGGIVVYSSCFGSFPCVPSSIAKILEQR